jgi:ATP-binding cassette subfamily C (CFTR/MRP) protein 1
VALTFISISSGYVALSLPIIAFALYAIQRFYLRTSKQMRMMDLESKAPLYTNFTESAAGLATIRAFGWTKACESHHEELLADSQKPYYLLFAIQRWLALVLDLVVAGLAVVTMGIAVGLRGKVSPGFMGVALINIITISEDLNNLIISWTKTEASMGSIARIKAFSETIDSEFPQQKTSSPKENWPGTGNIEFRDVSCAGHDDEENILTDITLTFRPGEKIGICGRTGSGKSSLAGLLFRLMDPNQGQILVDGVNLSTIDTEEIRSRIIGMAQDPCLLPGSIRNNLFCDRTDDEVIEVLTQFGLWQTLESKGGLDSELNEDTFSHGQKQLFCFVRAFLRQSTVIVLDEATSSMDQEMEATVTNAIHEKWNDRTVLSIAHRLKSIVGFDKILVLGGGRVLEFDTPENLLSVDSEFKKLYSAERNETQVES